MDALHCRARRFLHGLPGKSPTELHDAFYAEVIETGGTMLAPDFDEVMFFEITLYGSFAFGESEAELFRNWQRVARHDLDRPEPCSNLAGARAS
ncbi:hypothetical protein [Pseudorhodobacter sp.]|uniref:hypothetical protein n=1 Tax=Pseudorhodobacter sp. TaxID=1934400 RepID=UPI00264734B9|nr:hypothetical protein [Pseudorhodobacter sp.]MDN5786527.1 hypothetical protein [Pseudorhodobacter sp.]